MKKIIKFLTVEALFTLLQLTLSIFFIKTFISQFGISEYGLLVACVSALAIFTLIDWPLEVRLSKKLSVNRRHYPLNSVFYGKIFIMTLSMLILILTTNFTQVCLYYAYSFILCQYLITSIQTILNILQKPYISSILHITIPTVHSFAILGTIYLRGVENDFYIISTTCFLSITVLAVMFLLRNRFLKLWGRIRIRRLLLFYYRYWIVNYKIIFVRIRFILKQNAPVILINQIFGNEIVGIYGVIIRLTVIANAITSKFVYINLPSLLQSTGEKSRQISLELIAQIQKLCGLIFLVVTPISYFFVDEVLLYFTDDWHVNFITTILLCVIFSVCGVIAMLSVFLFVLPEFRRIIIFLVFLDVIYLFIFPSVYILEVDPISGILAGFALLLFVEAWLIFVAARKLGI